MAFSREAPAVALTTQLDQFEPVGAGKIERLLGPALATRGTPDVHR